MKLEPAKMLTNEQMCMCETVRVYFLLHVLGKKMKFLEFVGKWMEVENFVLNKISYIEKINTILFSHPYY